MRAVVFLYLFFAQYCDADYNDVVLYLKSIKTLKASFLQKNPDGTVGSGFMFLSIPGRLRFEYDNPEVVITINKGLLLYYDRQLDETTNIFISEKDPIFSLIKNPSDISSNEVKEVGNTIYVSKSGKEGKCTLIFKKNPMNVHSLVIEDINNEKTTVEFRDAVYNEKINTKLFTEF